MIARCQRGPVHQLIRAPVPLRSNCSARRLPPGVLKVISETPTASAPTWSSGLLCLPAGARCCAPNQSPTDLVLPCARIRPAAAHSLDNPSAPRFQPNSRGPNPIENTSTRTPNIRAAIKCPHSCTRIITPNTSATPNKQIHVLAFPFL